jgi:hypothetical protein
VSSVSALLIFVVFAIVGGMAFGLVRGAAVSSRPTLPPDERAEPRLPQLSEPRFGSADPAS